MVHTLSISTAERNRPLSGVLDLLRSESVKLWSVRSTYWTIVAALTFNLGFAAVEAILLPGRLSAQDRAGLDTIRVSLGGSHLTQVAIGVLGVLIITSEYTSGMIRATFSAVPRRRTLLAAKASVFAVTALIVGLVASFGAFFVFQALLTGNDFQSSIGDPGVVRALVGGGLYLTILGLLGLGLGAIIRSSAGAIAALFSLLFVPQILVELLPHDWKTTIGAYVPMEAGSQIFSQHHEAGALSPWAGLAVFALYAAVALTAGFGLISARDA
jgi:hypothetical protein